MSELYEHSDAIHKNGHNGVQKQTQMHTFRVLLMDGHFLSLHLIYTPMLMKISLNYSSLIGRVNENFDTREMEEIQ